MKSYRHTYVLVSPSSEYYNKLREAQQSNVYVNQTNVTFDRVNELALEGWEVSASSFVHSSNGLECHFVLVKDNTSVL